MRVLVKSWGDKPGLIDELLSAVREGRRLSSESNTSGVRLGLREQILGAEFMITF